MESAGLGSFPCFPRAGHEPLVDNGPLGHGRPPHSLACTQIRRSLVTWTHHQAAFSPRPHYPSLERAVVSRSLQAFLTCSLMLLPSSAVPLTTLPSCATTCFSASLHWALKDRPVVVVAEASGNGDGSGRVGGDPRVPAERWRSACTRWQRACAYCTTPRYAART